MQMYGLFRYKNVNYVRNQTCAKYSVQLLVLVWTRSSNVFTTPSYILATFYIFSNEGYNQPKIFIQSLVSIRARMLEQDF